MSSRPPEPEEKVIVAPTPPPSLVPPPDVLAGSPSVGSLLPAAPLSSLRDVHPPSSSRMLPALPAIEPLLGEAAAARARDDHEAALDAYKKAMLTVDASDTAAQASLYASVAEVKLAQGKKREAETNFEKALGVAPRHRRSFDGLLQLATEAGEWERVIRFRKKRAEVVEDLDERADELTKVADVCATRLNDPKRAAEALEAAAAARPGNVRLLVELLRTYEGQRQWPRALDTLDQLVRSTDLPRDRGAHRFAQADIVLGRLRDEPRGLAFLELALDEDPQNDRALSALVAVRTRREEWAELARVYETLIDRFAGLGDRERAWEVCRKLGVLRRDKLLDGPRALEAFRGAVELRPDDAESRAALAELYANKGERSAAVTELELVCVHAPTRAQTYRRLYELHTRAQRPDRAWLVATCLEELGAAEVTHDLVIEQFRPDGPIRPTTALEESLWDGCLRAPGNDAIVSDILRAISGAAIKLRLEALAAKRKLPALDPQHRQDKTSTASVVRTFVWAGRALGVELPDLFLLEDVPSGIAAVPAPSPATALGPQVRSGMGVQQLAFLAGRHLTYYRPEHYALVFFPTLAELSALVLAAVRLVLQRASMAPRSDEDGLVASQLGGRLSAAEKKALEDAVGRLDARGGRLDLLAWIRHVELTAARAGLLLCGDLRIAMRMLNAETRAVGELSLETKRGDLLAFTASDAYGKLRERMGVAILPTSAPAAGSA